MQRCGGVNGPNSDRSKHLELKGYMMKHTFSWSKFKGVMLDRLTLFLGNFKKAYIIIPAITGEMRILTVTQNNEKETIGFPGGRIIVDVSKCPANAGKCHEFVTYSSGDTECLLCRMPEFIDLYSAGEEKRTKIWESLKKWVQRWQKLIKILCMETYERAAVRELKEETGISEFTEDQLKMCTQIRDNSGNRFFITPIAKEFKIFSAVRTDEIKCIQYRSLRELENLSRSEKMSYSHSSAFKCYLNTDSEQ